MNKAYVILAHKHPAQLKRLIKTLDDGRSFFFVHIDSAANLQLFKDVQYSNNIQLLPRERTGWASFGIVRAVLHGLEAAQASGLAFRHVILLSGQCYPIRSNEYINAFVEEHADKTFLEYYHLPAPDKWQPAGGMYRVNKYFIGLQWQQRLCSRSLNLLSRYVPFLQRKLYGNMEPYAGSMWWMLNRSAVTYILNFVKAHPGYTAFHRYTFAPDELFFHMILLNARPQELAGTIINNDKRYIQWKHKTAAHPEPIVAASLPHVMASEALFARKFNSEQDSSVLDFIDNYRLFTNNNLCNPVTIS